ncbi:transcription-repair coupling factor [Janibacter alittae]|uniref:Transcription-repair-coupling factor n=1 Tax=Janibacter alittae TaxID=3115209 RepID=A0ABZ2MFM1_9MICO
MSSSLTPLLSAIAGLPGLADIPRHRAGTDQLDIVAPTGLRAPTVATIGGAAPGDAPQLIITSTAREADDLSTALGEFVDPDLIATFPSWETLPHERLSPRSDTVGRRLAVLRRLSHPQEQGAGHGPLGYVIASVRAVLQPIARGLGDLEPVTLRVGDERPLTDIAQALTDAAYVRTDLVDRRGEFAVRGGILDVFPPTEEHPIRVEFFGDTVDEIRWFKVADQRSLDATEVLWAPPCREVLLTDSVRERAAALAEDLPGVADMLHKVAEGIAVEGMESLAPALVDGMESLLDVLPKEAGVLVLDHEKVRARAHDLVSTSEEFLQASWANAAAGNVVPIDLEGVLGTASHWTLAQARDHALDLGLPWWSITPFAVDEELDALAADMDDRVAHDHVALRVPAAEPPTFRGNTEAAVAQLAEWTTAGWWVLIATDGAGLVTRVAEVLRGADVPTRVVGEEDDLTELSEGVVTVTRASLGTGFVAADHRLAVLTEADLLGSSGAGASTRDMRRMPSRRRKQVDPLQLRPGDHVVHEQHGVGSFVEMIQRTIGGATREYLVIEYAPSRRGHPGDRLFVPSDQLDQVTRYVGGDAPALNKMGGSDWQKTKSKAKRHVRQIAGELIRLYSARMATPGHTFGPDTPWQRELEDAFAHIETPDQLSTIDEVKADMEKSFPMDRLICGDVGYGKTEIAVRAAFKAIQDGKQVAALVPTTLLVQQHLNTFSERYAGYPVTVKALSRFQTDAEAKEVLAGLQDGSVDLVIGTHRILGNEVKFKDLGMVIIDEEQRFGVEHKEQLKALRTNVDVLAMSATPIPRTLEMAVTGIREMSTLATPPEERHPVLTFVGGYEEKQVSAAIHRELMREGQVFFVHNNVSTIERTAARIRELVPDARVETAHGKMGEHRLEQVVLDFWERRFDVLVCTTIVETGLDISNANTLILDRADKFGLSQLHQLRGRVGRGRERAYAYFLYPPDKPLTETAHDRLTTIASNTDLGSGMQVAMKDLEIRGAGNLLGGEQSGHIAGVGFDLYVRMVGEAVADFKGEGEAAPAEVKIELPVDAHLPHEYVPGERLRLEAYRKLAAAETEEDLTEIVEELTDRYGEPPEPVRNLVAVARLRIVVRAAGLTDVVVQGKNVRFAPARLKESQQLRLARLYPKSSYKEGTQTVLVPKPMTARIGGSPLRDTEVLQWATDLVDQVMLDNVIVDTGANPPRDTSRSR